MPDMTNRGAAYRRAYPGLIRNNISSAIALIENARITLTPHRRHLESIDSVIIFLGKIQEELQKQRDIIRDEIPTTPP